MELDLLYVENFKSRVERFLERGNNLLEEEVERLQ